MIGIKKTVWLLVAGILILGSFSALGAEMRFADSEPLCFEGDPDYSYEDEQLYIHIKQYNETHTMNGDERNLVYYVADVQVKNVSCLMTAWAKDKPLNSTSEEPVSRIAERKGAVLAINADFIGSYSGGIIIRNGELLRAKTMQKRQLLIVDKNGGLSAIREPISKKAQSTETAERLTAEETWQTFIFGPVLVENGEYAGKAGSPFAAVQEGEKAYNPRTGIGQISPLHYIIVVVDGRKESHSFGLNLKDFAQLFIDHGADFAFNLDGGGSTTLWFMGEVINRPGAGKERDVSDILYFAPYTEENGADE